MNLVRKILSHPLLLVVIILCTAGIFRLTLLQYTEFKGDEALNLLLASRPIFHHPFPPASQASSAGILNFPLLNYLLFPFVLFTLYPPTVSFVIALLNILTIGGFFLLFKKYHGKVTAFLASTTLALSPWAILYSRKIWAQDFLLPLSLPFFLSLYKIIEGRKKYWFLFGISSMFLMQIHQLALIVPLVFFIGLLGTKHRPSWKLLGIGIVVGLIPTIPYVWYMLQIHFSDFQATTTLEGRFLFRSAITFFRPLQIISIGDFHTVFGDDFALFAQQFHVIYLFSKLSYVAYIGLPLGAIIFWVKNKIYRFFVICTLIVLLLYFLLGIEPLMHYYILLIPFFALFIASIVQIAINKKIYYFILFLFFTYFLSLALFDYGFLALLAKRGGLGGSYGAGYISSRASAEKALAKFKGQPNYQEILLFYFAPMQYLHGYMPVGKMIFPYGELKQNEITREKEFRKTPLNPLLRDEIFAYYTQKQNPTWDDVFFLKEKSKQNPSLSFVYETVLGNYLATHFKNLHETPNFLLLYPRHWSKQNIPNGVNLTDGTVIVTIKEIVFQSDAAPLQSSFPYKISSSSIGGVSTQKSACNNKAWCGDFYAPISIGTSLYQFSLYAHAENMNQTSVYAHRVFDEIIKSITVLR